MLKTQEKTTPYVFLDGVGKSHLYFVNDLFMLDNIYNISWLSDNHQHLPPLVSK